MAASDADAWGERAESYAVVASKVTNFMAEKALVHHSRLWTSLEVDPVLFLDVAAGPGIFSKLVSEKLIGTGKEYSIACTDFSEGMLVQAKDSIKDPKVRFLQMDGQDMSAFADASVDGLSCMFGIMFMPEVKKCIDEIKRVLKPGASATVATWLKAGMSELADAYGEFLGSLEPGEPSPVSKHMQVGRDPDVLAQYFKDSGFSDVRVEQLDKVFSFEDLQVIFHFLVDNPMLKMSFQSSKPGAKDATVENFTDFMTNSPSSLAFRNTNDKPGCSVRFTCNLAVAQA